MCVMCVCERERVHKKYCATDTDSEVDSLNSQHELKELYLNMED